MTPLTVEYHAAKPKPGQIKWAPGMGIVVNSITPQGIAQLRAGINSGKVNHVVLVGQYIAVGWRIYTDREVSFITPRKTAVQRQAAGRIIQDDPS